MLKKLKKDIDLSLRSFLKGVKKRPDIRSAGPILYDCIEDFICRNGKRIRPLLFLVGYLGYTNRKNVPYKKLLRCSLSLELLHDFLLIHDDVIDNSDLRRGKPTLHRLFNKKLRKSTNNKLGSDLSIVSGDIIFALSADALISFDENPSRKEKTLRIFMNTAAATGTGEFIDVINNLNKIEKVTEKDIFLTYTLKTAKYTFEAPLIMGAILAGAKQTDIERLSSLGLLLGQAFQIQDDLLDVFSSSKKIGKPILSDLNESKKTLLVWKAYNSLKGKDKKALKHLLEKERKTYADLLKFRKMIISSGAKKYCLEKAASFFRKSDEICSTLRMKRSYKTALKHFIETLAVKI